MRAEDENFVCLCDDRTEKSALVAPLVRHAVRTCGNKMKKKKVLVPLTAMNILVRTWIENGETRTPIYFTLQNLLPTMRKT